MDQVVLPVLARVLQLQHTIPDLLLAWHLDIKRALGHRHTVILLRRNRIA